MRGEKLITHGIDRRAERQEENRHARGKTCDPPAVQHLLGAYLFVQSPGADRVADACQGKTEQNPRLETPGEEMLSRQLRVRESLCAKAEINRNKGDDASGAA